MKKQIFADWNVQLAKTYKPELIKPSEWFAITQKINGVRATWFANQMVSRTGHDIVGFTEIAEELKICQSHLKEYYKTTFAIDGELRISGEGPDDNTLFRDTVSIVNSENDWSRKGEIRFIIFDLVPAHEWAYDMCTLLYATRNRILGELKDFIVQKNLTHLKIVPVFYTGSDIDAIEHYAEYAANNNMEGIMINRNDTYQFRRTDSLLKYKKFKTIDLKVCGFVEGKGKYSDMLGALSVSYKGNVVNVGSGFTDLDRYNIWHSLMEDQTKIIGRIIEVKYKDETFDEQTGLPSLQFPVFMGFRNDKIKPDTL